MKKKFIFFSTLLLLISISAGIIYAWLTSSARIKGVSISAGTAEVLINDATEFTPNPALNFTDLYPSFNQKLTDFTVKNSSSAEIALDIVAQIEAPELENTDLGDQVQLALVLRDQTPSETDYYDLDVWAGQTGIDLINLDQNQAQDFDLYLKVKDEAPDEIQNDALNFDLVLTGTQAH